MSGVELAQGRGRKAVTLLTGFDLEVADGERIAIIGSPASSAAAVLGLLAGTERPSAGEIEIFGRTVPEALAAADIGVVAGTAALRSGWTVERSLSDPLERAGMDYAGRGQRVRDLAARTGLADHLGVRVGALSPAQRCRAAIAAALAPRPRVLVLAEPFAGLNAFTRERQQLDLLRMLVGVGAALILATDSVDEAVFLADRVVALAPGAGPRPGSGPVLGEVEIPFRDARPEGLREQPEFFDRVVAVRAALRGDPAALSSVDA